MVPIYIELWLDQKGCDSHLFLSQLHLHLLFFVVLLWLFHTSVPTSGASCTLPVQVYDFVKGGVETTMMGARSVSLPL